MGRFLTTVMLTELTISSVSEKAEALDQVKKLWRANSDTLGWFTNGAFDDHARRGRILTAHSPEGDLAAYLIFRVAKGRAMIAHLCCDERFKGQGCARALFDRLRDLAAERDLRGIGLHCRRDYPAYSLWPKLGFAPRGSKVGRGSDNVELTLWWFDLHAPDLFSNLEQRDERLVAVLDNNVFRDLHDTTEARNQEAQFLLADWLAGQLELCIVDELLVELDGIPLGSPREKLLQNTRAYRELTPHSAEIATVLPNVQSIFGHTTPTPSQSADMRYVAKAVAAQADIFLTRDEEILEKAAEIEVRFGLQVTRPVDLISRLNEAERATLYQPVRFAGTDIEFSRPRADCLDDLAAAFQNVADEERRDWFRARLRSAVADAAEQHVSLARADGKPLFLLSWKGNGDCRDLNILRAAPGPLGATALRHALLAMLREIAERGTGILSVSDPLLGTDVHAILNELGFRRLDGRWQKIALRYVGPPDETLSALGTAGVDLPTASLTTEAALDFEANYWPAKLLRVGVPTWIVPIKPGWATPLFETKFAGEQLFPPRRDLILNRENVYYSAATQAGMRGSRGRILWYASQDRYQAGSMSIRACSRLVEARQGNPRELFREFKRLGIFEWRDIAALTNGKPKAEILALRFADTELFSEPVSFEFTREIGIVHNFASPVRVSDELFEKIYRRGMQLKSNS